MSAAHRSVIRVWPLAAAKAGAPATKGRLVWRDREFPCALGRGGVVAATEKREGDGATPAGLYALERVYFRPDRGPRPATRLPLEEITPDLGWCDDAGDAAYNGPVTLPHPAGAEEMWRQDGLYDLVVVLDHNRAPPRPGWGSAIFLHIAREGLAPTRGCVALERPALEVVIAEAGPETMIRIHDRPRRG